MTNTTVRGQNSEQVKTVKGQINTDEPYDNSITNIETETTIETEDDPEPWKTELSDILHEMDWFGFERLCKRLLRECGFSKVEVTKKSGDNGIDGVGRILLNGLVSISVAFQCKRHKEAISNSQIRDFRGSLNSNIEKGIFITTSSFTKAAIEEASDPAKKPHIDLIDGEELISLLIEKELGVMPVNAFKVDKNFFDSI